ncbi:S8 family serine peptidase, partial [Promineifilum sp.]|uniref:S8 family serine peptidase n=1 Tax=Promineifilum sp. TaxID=2664178 RepID=UPI0035B20EF7
MSTRRVKLFVLVAAVVMFTLILGGRTARPALADGDIVPGQYIVQLAPGPRANAANVGAVASDLGRAYGLRISHVYEYALTGFAARIPATRLAQLQADPRVLSIEPDRVFTIQAQTLPTGINRIDGELSSTVSGNGSGSVSVDVAVLDTGIQTNHPDLNVVGG